jgi:hypothetical protein
MAKKTEERKRLSKEIRFKMKNNQSLVISCFLLPDAGLERVIVENKNGITNVHAIGRTRFEFCQRKKHDPSQCDFWLANPKDELMIEDIIRSKFWGQFTYNDLFKYGKDKKFNRALNRKIKKLVEEFEKKASQELNQMRKQYKNGSNK